MKLRNIITSNKHLLTILGAISLFISKIHWPRLQAVLNGGVYYRLAEDDHDQLRRILRDHYGLILTRRNSHLTTYIIAMLSMLIGRKPAHYVHALMNVEGDVDLNKQADFKLIEATGKGVHYSTFMQVFDCDSVAVLKPRGISMTEWTLVLDDVKASYGTKYDILFDLTSEHELSCVELIYKGLKKLPNYRERFPQFIAMVEEKGELDPQMLYDSGDFDVAFEVRR